MTISALRLVAFLVICVLPGALEAQDPADDEPVTIGVVPGSGELRVEVGDVLDDPGLRAALHSGLPIRVLLEVELWKDRFFDSQRGKAEWRATVVYEPLDRTYSVQTSTTPGTAVLGTLDEASRHLSEAFSLSLRPREEGRFYYGGSLEVETLSLSDLEELQRWLRGDVTPAVSGERDVDAALEGGIRRIVVRMLGLPARRFRVRTPTFEISGKEPPRFELLRPLRLEYGPPNGVRVDPIQIRLDADARSPGDRQRPVGLKNELRLDQVPFPVAIARRDITG